MFPENTLRLKGGKVSDREALRRKLHGQKKKNGSDCGVKKKNLFGANMPTFRTTSDDNATSNTKIAHQNSGGKTVPGGSREECRAVFQSGGFGLGFRAVEPLDWNNWAPSPWSSVHLNTVN